MPIMPIVRCLPKLDSTKIGQGFVLSEISHHWMLTKTELTREKINSKLIDLTFNENINTTNNSIDQFKYYYQTTGQ